MSNEPKLFGHIVGEILDGDAKFFSGLALLWFAASCSSDGLSSSLAVSVVFLPSRRTVISTSLPGFFIATRLWKFGRFFDGLAVKCDDDVSGFKARFGCRRIRRNIGNDDAFGILEFERFSQFGRDVLDGDAEESADDFAFLDKLVINTLWPY